MTSLRRKREQYRRALEQERQRLGLRFGLRAEELTDEEVIRAIRSVPTHFALAIDGTPAHKNITTGSSTTITLTSTSNTNDIIGMAFTINGTNVSSISSSNTTGWALRKRQIQSGSNGCELWWGKAAGTLSSETFTVNLAGATGFCTIDVFAISGGDTTNIWDSNAALPNGSAGTTASYTTTNANDMLIGVFRMGSGASPTAAAGWTAINGSAGADFQLVQYKVVSATQSGLTATSGSGTPNACIGDAILQASAGGGPFPHYIRRQMAGGMNPHSGGL